MPEILQTPETLKSFEETPEIVLQKMLIDSVDLFEQMLANDQLLAKFGRQRQYGAPVKVPTFKDIILSANEFVDLFGTVVEEQGITISADLSGMDGPDYSELLGLRVDVKGKSVTGIFEIDDMPDHYQLPLNRTICEALIFAKAEQSAKQKDSNPAFTNRYRRLGGYSLGLHRPLLDLAA